MCSIRGVAAYLLVTFAAAGCTLSTQGKTACEQSDDCVRGYTCVERLCVSSAAIAERPGGSDDSRPKPKGDASSEGGTGGTDSNAGRGGARAPGADTGTGPGPADGGGEQPMDAPDIEDGSDGMDAVTIDAPPVLSDPCDVEHGGCDPLVSCSNQQGVAVCGPCPDGYEAQGTNCVDRNECETASDTCDPDPAACVNEVGGFRCECPASAGFVGSGVGPNGCSRKVVELAAGSMHTCARFNNGTVKCWGDNSRGQLGLGDTASRGTKAGEMGDALPAIDLGPDRTALRIAAGRVHTCALLDDGSVKCWGHNRYGQLGQGSSCLSACEDTSTAVLDLRGDEPGEMGDQLRPIPLGTDRTAKAITAGDDFNCALLDDDSVKCWGKNDRGQLGQGTSCTSGCGAGGAAYDHRGDEPDEMGDALPAVALGTSRKAIALSAGADHVCAVLDDRSLKCWGANGSAQLGTDDQYPRGDGPGEMGDMLLPVALGVDDTSGVLLAAGAAHTCVVLDGRALKCWGDNAFGQLGLEDARALRGGTPDDPIHALLAVQLSSTLMPSGLECGVAHCCARLGAGTLKCWGGNELGQLGLGDQEARGNKLGDRGDGLPAVRVLPVSAASVASVAAGSQHTCAVADDGSVRCFGRNGEGQLGIGLTSAAFGGDASALVLRAPMVELGK